jgi:hypothetical protein
MAKKNAKAKKTFLPDLPLKQRKGDILDETLGTLPPPKLCNLRELPDWLDGDLYRWLDTAFHLAHSEPELARLILMDITIGVRAVAKALRTGSLTIMPEVPEEPAWHFVQAARTLLRENDPDHVDTAVAELLDAGERARVAQEGA